VQKKVSAAVFNYSATFLQRYSVSDE